ncbi:methyl-accepting chemotaxis sensory transducer with Cache sensor [Natranaerovirga pectinivora]|uniref:Methyl-accepting chemotaxis sensory transducer with Cache sensor n=1 Tax=Natranaerovirga pectinivora TaxID=682400 RepID=A0A4R3MJV1_9FIRM|nr:methyl-accepting chemotaxis protein [Natranaerovirga pectinivora]TCT12881.1 methyl-accepting chemotaxis sensory transducer with Cache sensor [Natranaerovirga pectinivora]
MKKISHKILLAIILTSFILTTGFGMYNISYMINNHRNELKLLRESLLDDYDIMIKNQVETAVSLIEYSHNQYRLGNITQNEAKEQSKRLIRTLKYGEEGYFWIDDTKGVLIEHPVAIQAIGTNRIGIEDPNGVKLIQNIIDSGVNKTNDGFTEYMWEKPDDNSGELYIKRAYSQLFEPWDWIISTGNYIDSIENIVQIRQEEYTSALKLSIIVTVLFVLFSSILTLIIAIVLSRKITKPIVEMVNNIKKDEDGNISIKEINIQSKDEIGQLAMAINTMIEQVKHFIEETKQISDNVVDYSQGLSNVAEESTASIEGVSRAMEELTQGVAEQASATQNGSETLNTLANEINTVVEITNNLRNYIIGADKSGQMGLQAVTNLQDSFSIYNDKSNHLTKGIEILVYKSESIGTIIEAIQGIAAQTNLLALNASIEAARAGEAGKGFAVVADEIRKLAEGTAQSTKQIGDMVNDIQAQVINLTNNLGETKILFDKVDESILHTGNAFGTIEDAVKNTISEVDKLLDNTNKINSRKDLVVKVIEDISATAEESAASSEEISASLEEQTRSIDEISTTATELQHISTTLQSVISKFKL